MQKLLSKLSAAQSGEICSGFRLIKKEHVAAKSAELYTLRHEKTGAELLYFDRADGEQNLHHLLQDASRG